MKRTTPPCTALGEPTLEVDPDEVIDPALATGIVRVCMLEDIYIYLRYVKN